MFSPDKWEVLSEINSVLCITIVCFFLGRKLSSQQGPAHYARILVLSLFSVSWAFNLISTLLVSTNNNNILSCSLSIFMCITLYAMSKILIYLFLIEKIYVVVSNEQSRYESKLYRINIVLLLPYIAIFILMIVYRTAYIMDDGTYFCHIGLGLPATLSLVAYDFFITTYYTLMFCRMLIWPAEGASGAPGTQTSLRYVAKRNLVAAVVALIVSSANVVILITLDGVERGLVCLTSCTLDVTINATAIFWVTSHQSEIEHLNRQRLDRKVKLEIKQHQEVIIMREIATRL
ncbi:hypothetical protein K450DRAFT_224097 [Umbelopsis ramanniana AG]|uniref:Uncharacterized protein n=1 Tax=Umbelopsis ramanniana AG TaxID=1314678 RepID=A0AAD5EGR8_UMBRA|nr:uncharacterized protein K450DRAFT_224097 [Umbelopsis ramanniana AG]KAI8583077.1 hypothetical protein K450DRAFT_224097 [Umbelopsis ramanniana AG]